MAYNIAAQERIFREATELGKERNKKYGPDNIRNGGMLGCAVRNLDKAHRMATAAKNMVKMEGVNELLEALLMQEFEIIEGLNEQTENVINANRAFDLIMRMIEQTAEKLFNTEYDDETLRDAALDGMNYPNYMVQLLNDEWDKGGKP